MRRSLSKYLALAFLCLNVSAESSAAEIFPEDAFLGYEADIENGKQILLAAGCATCHGVEGNAEILAGGREIETKFGDLYAPNITAHPELGIGSWSNSNFLNAVLNGVGPDGDTYFGAVFPYAAYSRMKPEDALDMKAYMATLPQSDAVSKDHKINFINASVLDLWSSDREALPTLTDPQLARGQYLVEALGHCAECHTPRETRFGMAYNLDSSRPFMGETGILGDYAPNISQKRLVDYGPEAFVIGALSEAKKLNGSPMSSVAMRRIAQSTGALSMADRAAMYAYLTGAPLDLAILPKETPKAAIAAAAAPNPGPDLEDRTGADELMQRINAYCEAPEAQEASIAAVSSDQVGTRGKLLQQAADEVLETHCRSCHGPGQTYQQSFLTGDILDIARDPAAVVRGDAEKSTIYESIASNRMPLGKKLTTAELKSLSDWIVGLDTLPNPNSSPKPEPVQVERLASEMPKFIGGSLADHASAAMSDLNQLSGRDHRFVRYFSFAQIPLPPVDCAVDGLARNPVRYFHAGLNKFLNSVSRSTRLATVVPVDGTNGALVRIDLRDYGWTRDDWSALTTAQHTAGAVEAGYNAEVWHDMARRYPYGIDPASNPFLSVLANATRSGVPMMRADWFVRFASESPYYDMLLRLPANIRDLEARMNVDVDAEIRAANVVRAGFSSGASGVSDFNRMLERFDLSRGGYYWKSYDFGGDTGVQSLINHPDGPASVHDLPSGTIGFEHDGGEMIFSLPNGMQGYYLSTAEGDRLSVGPTSIVSFRKKAIGKGVEVVNARSCFECHENGMIAKRDELRRFIEVANTYDFDSREVLLLMYPEQDVIDGYFRQDAYQFINALQEIGVTQASASGRPVSLQAPAQVGGGEIITYLADIQFNNLELEAVAREFYLTSDEFLQRSKSLADPVLKHILDGWIAKLDADLFVTRAEIDANWGHLMPRLTAAQPFRSDVFKLLPEASLSEAASAAYSKAASGKNTGYTPANSGTSKLVISPTRIEGKLQLTLSVPSAEVRVGDVLAFDLTANKRCELQILYIEGNNNVEDLPQGLLGPAFLEAGETRRIPYPGTNYQLRFDSPGEGETMLAFCRENGLGAHRLVPAEAMRRARERYQPLDRGIIIETADQVGVDEGLSAINVVTFNVSP